MSASLLPSTPPVQCAPIYKIEYAQHKPDYGPMPRKPYLPVPDDTHSAVNDALKLALQLLVHPQSIKVVAQLICDSESESDIEATRRAIHKILADTKWYIGLSDQYRAKGDYAWYTRCEPRLARTTWARTLYLSERLANLLTQATEGSRSSRNLLLLLTAASLSREMIHALRLYTFVLLRGQVDIPLEWSPSLDTDRNVSDRPIPADQCPSSEHRLTDSQPSQRHSWRKVGTAAPADAGDVWEDMVLGGQLEAMSPLIDSPYESPPSSLDGNGIAHFMTANDIDLEALEAAEPTADTRWDKEIPMLLKRGELPTSLMISRICEGEIFRYRVDDQWLNSAINAFENGCFEEVRLPVISNPAPLDSEEYALLSAFRGRFWKGFPRCTRWIYMFP